MGQKLITGIKNFENLNQPMIRKPAFSYFECLQISFLCANIANIVCKQETLIWRPSKYEPIRPLVTHSSAIAELEVFFANLTMLWTHFLLSEWQVFTWQLYENSICMYALKIKRQYDWIPWFQCNSTFNLTFHRFRGPFHQNTWFDQRSWFQ